MFRPAGLVNEAADFIRIAIPEAADAAVFAMLLPKLRIDVVVLVERSDELIAMPRRTSRKLLRPGKFEPNALEYMWQRHG